MRALVTGAAGFVGQWLCRELLEHGWEVTGAALEMSATPTLSAAERGAVRWLRADVRDAASLRAALAASRPDALFHLAGVSYVPKASADPAAALDVNTLGAVRLLREVQGARDAGELDPVVLIVGSGLQYGSHPREEQPLPETAEQRPVDLYAASKAAQEIVALQAFRAHGVRVVCTRSFNHSGAGQEPHFLLPRLAREATALRTSGGSELTLGNLSSARDYLHVADVARAYRLLAERGEAGEAYNVSSGCATTVADAAARVLALAGVDARLRVDPALQRAADVPTLVGDPAKLKARTGWAPERSLDHIIDDLLRAASR